MSESGDTSASAGSSADGSSLPTGSSADTGDTAGLRVDFYVIDDASSAARLKLACKLAEKAYLASQSALVWHTDLEELRTFDEMLWTFSDGSFVPHEMLGATGIRDVPVLLSSGTPPSRNVDIIINLAQDVPPCLSQTRRIAEIIDGDDTRRRAGRARFKAYRELGVQPTSHNIRSGE
jgi:DNA polymerase III subunit chi